MRFIDNWCYTLTSGMEASDSTLPVPAAALDRLGLGEGVAYTLTLINSLSPLEQGEHEIVILRGQADGGHMLDRGQEGTAPRAWKAGSYVYCSVTAGLLTRLLGQIEALRQRVEELEGGSGQVPAGALTDASGNVLTDMHGNILVFGA